MSLIAIPNLSLSAPVDFIEGGGDSVLLFSMRRVADLVGYVAMYEFEDVIAELSGADVVRPTNLEGLELPRRVYKLARMLTRSRRFAESVRLAGKPLKIDKQYELFLAVFNHPHELFALNAIDGWRDRSLSAACYLCEAWDAELPVYLVEMLKRFDHIFVGVNGALDAVAKISGRPVTYLPMGVDALRFCPFPNPPARFIDMCGIGRRSPVTHAALLKWSSEKGTFYYYDTVQASAPTGGPPRITTFRVSNPGEHRRLIANVLKRSKYFIANRAWADRPELTGGKDEIAARFYEGAAAGTIMLGDPPKSEDFRLQFGWKDPVIPIPFHCEGIAATLAELEADPDRCERIRRDSVANTLLQHDWVYRLRTIRTALGLGPTPQQLAREARLRELANEIGVERVSYEYATR
jgi:hypothetical protein